MEAFDAAAMEAPATLPAALVEAAPAPRPPLVRGAQPTAAVVLVEIDVQGLEA